MAAVSTSKSSRFGFARFERWIDALLDPARERRAVAWTLAAYAAIWTAYRIIATLPRDLHTDVTELYGWSRDLALGYAKHPPFSAFVARLWITLFPVSDLTFHVLATANIALTLYIAWVTMRRLMGPEKSAFGLALLMLIPFFNFIALKYNANAVLLPLWAACIYCFLRVFEAAGQRQSPGLLWPALAGVFAGAAMLGKYWSVVLVASLGLAALADPRRAAFFRSPAPWLMIAAGGAVLAPHLWWLVQSHFPTFDYAAAHSASGLSSNLADTLFYLAGCVGYASVALIAALWLLRPSRAALRDIAWPADPQRRLVLLIQFMMIVLPVPFALLSGIRIVPLWTMPAWTLLPVVLLASPLIEVGRASVRAIALGAALLTVGMLALAPAVALAIHRYSAPGPTEYASVLADNIAREWQRHSDRPIPLVVGPPELAASTAYYLRTHVRPLGTDNFTTVKAEALAHGAVVVCPAEDSGCQALADRIVAEQPQILRGQAWLSRSLFGIAGKPVRDVFLIVPPPATAK